MEQRITKITFDEITIVMHQVAVCHTKKPKRPINFNLGSHRRRLRRCEREAMQIYWMSAGVIETSVRERESAHRREWRRRAIWLRSAVCSGWCLKPWERESRLPVLISHSHANSFLLAADFITATRALRYYPRDVCKDGWWMCSLKLKTVWGLWWARDCWLTHAEAKPTRTHTHTRAFGPESVLILIGRRYFLPRANTNLAFAHTPDAKMKLFASPRGDRANVASRVKRKKPLTLVPPAAITDCALTFLLMSATANFINIMQNSSRQKL